MINSISYKILIFLFSFFLNAICLYFLIPILKKYSFSDKPNARSSHQIIKPTGGGISFVLLSILYGIFFKFWTPIICFPLALLGFFDDRKSVHPLLRYFLQLITVLCLIYFNVLNLILPLSLVEQILILFILIFIGTSIINFTNFMDGVDGLICSCMSILLFTAANEINFDFSPFLGLLLGFIYWNWYPSRIFMGDVGSTFLGALFVSFLFQSKSLSSAFIIILAGLPLWGDAIITILRRFFSGENIFKPHKKHLYQRLVLSGLKHNQVTLIYGSATFFLSIISIQKDLSLLLSCSVLILILGLILDKYFASPFFKT